MMEEVENRRLLGKSCATQLVFSSSFIILQHILQFRFCLDYQECIRESVKIFLVNVYLSVVLGWLVSGATVVNGNSIICRDTRSKVVCFLKSIFITFCGNCLYHFITVIYGAPFIQYFEETHLFSCLMSSFTFLNLSLISDGKWWTIMQIIDFKLYKNGQMMDNVRLISFLAILGALAGSATIPLDWDRPWQAWPVPCCIGAAIGYFTGLLIFTMLPLLEFLKLKYERTKIKYY